MAPFDQIEIELSVLIGETTLPLQRLLKLERGGVIALGKDAAAPLAVLANGARVAAAKVELNGPDVRVVVVDGQGA